MRYQPQTTTSCGIWPPATQHVVVSASQGLLVRYQRCRCPKFGHGPPDWLHRPTTAPYPSRAEGRNCDDSTLARPTGVWRARTTYELAIEGRDRRLAAARRWREGPDCRWTRHGPRGRCREGASRSSERGQGGGRPPSPTPPRGPPPWRLRVPKVGATTTAHLVWILGPRLVEPADQAEAVPWPQWSPLRAVFAKGESRRGPIEL